LSNDVDLTAEIGNKIYPSIAPRHIEPTFMVYSIVSSNTIRTKDDPFPLTNYLVQIDTYSENALNAIEVNDLAKKALSRKTGEYGSICIFSTTIDSEMDGYSGEDEVFRKTLKFEIIAKNLN
jgi:hypothetical protein